MDTNQELSPRAVNTEVGFDHTDLSIRGIIIFLAGVGIAGVITHLVIWGLYVGAQKLVPYQLAANPMATMETMEQAPPLQNAGPTNIAKFPEPQLQTDDTADMSKFEQYEEMQLHPAQPVQTADGAIHIDIDEAMKLIAQRGLPTRQSIEQTQAPDQTPGTKGREAARAGSSAGLQ